ncbi:hypothetical protein N480_23480 [Pseudoalteromonas luteoviolacea S2607]|uniref:M48 family metallopeptidase n=1 Tax=Pseudoalteromonas luteoviolacea TaxID=43657 RepID=UPI0007B08006|nr:M48 family metallopeptidase [Pseudoalteromonas luteoviolacea]KZN33741.1 hypothetical protein N480_23480 [Pseudoalteromonas luteoviolacea S2607]
MDRKQEKIQNLLAQAERDLSNDPKLYERKLFRYSILGYAIILAITFVLFGLFAGTVWLAFSSSMFLLLLFKKKLFIPLLIMAWVLFKSVFIRWPKPEGVIITREHSPELFSIIDELQCNLKAPRIHQVIITPEFNAAIVQTPRFLAFGFMHNTLIVGFELLLSLTIEETKSVVAHELAHLSGNHSKFSGCIYRARESWQNMMFNLEQHNGWTTAPIRAFFNWYSPRFSAYSFALARQNEYEADHVAGEQSSNEVAASALLKLHAYSNFIQENYWKPFSNSILELPEPHILPFAGLVKFMQQNEISANEAISAINFAKKEVTNYRDTHPCLTDRLTALKGESIDFSPTENSAVKRLFGERVNEVAMMLDAQWSEWNLDGWKQEHKFIQEEKLEYDRLKIKGIKELSKDELWRLAYLQEKFVSENEAIRLYRAFNELYPNDADGQFALGKAILAQKDDTGLQYLEKASAKHELLEASSKVAYMYLVDKERTEEANVWLERMHNLEGIYREASKERNAVSCKDTIEPTTIPENLLAPLVKQIKANKKVKAAWVAQKKVKNFADSHVLIFAVNAKSGFYISDNLAEKIIGSLEIESDITVFVLTKGNDKKLYKNVITMGKQVI